MPIPGRDVSSIFAPRTDGPLKMQGEGHNPCASPVPADVLVEQIVASNLIEGDSPSGELGQRLGIGTQSEQSPFGTLSFPTRPDTVRAHISHGGGSEERRHESGRTPGPSVPGRRASSNS